MSHYSIAQFIICSQLFVQFYPAISIVMVADSVNKE